MQIHKENLGHASFLDGTRTAQAINMEDNREVYKWWMAMAMAHAQS
jgi:hypothetical protein